MEESINQRQEETIKTVQRDTIVKVDSNIRLTDNADIPDKGVVEYDDGEEKD